MTKRVDTFAYDDNGNLTAHRDPCGWLEAWRYDNDDRLALEMNKRGLVRQVKYGCGGVVAQETLWEPSEITNAATQCRRNFTGEQSGGLLSTLGSTLYSMLGDGAAALKLAVMMQATRLNPGRVTGRILSKVDYERDLRGRVKAEKRLKQDVDNPRKSETVTFATEWWSRSDRVHKQMGPDGQTIVRNYDQFGRLKDETLQGGDKKVSTSWQYDDATNQMTVTRPEGQIRQTQDRKARTVEVVDLTNNNFLLQKSTYSKGGLLLSTKSQYGEETYDAFDSSLRWQSKTVKAWGVNMTEDKAVSLTHKQVFDDAKGWLKEQSIGGGGLEFKRAYDQWGASGPRLSSVNGKPVQKVSSFDGNGNPTKYSDANDTTWQAAYDGYGEVLTLTARHGSTLMHKRAMQRDALGRPVGVWDYQMCHYAGPGSVVRTKDTLPVVNAFRYDTAGNLIGEDQTLGGITLGGKTFGGQSSGGQTRTMSYTYTASGRPDTTFYPAAPGSEAIGGTLSKVGITALSKGLATQTLYDELGRPRESRWDESGHGRNWKTLVTASYPKDGGEGWSRPEQVAMQPLGDKSLFAAYEPIPPTTLHGGKLTMYGGKLTFGDKVNHKEHYTHFRREYDTHTATGEPCISPKLVIDRTWTRGTLAHSSEESSYGDSILAATSTTLSERCGEPSLRLVSGSKGLCSNIAVHTSTERRLDVTAEEDRVQCTSQDGLGRIADEVIQQSRKNIARGDKDFTDSFSRRVTYTYRKDRACALESLNTQNPDGTFKRTYDIGSYADGSAYNEPGVVIHRDVFGQPVIMEEQQSEGSVQNSQRLCQRFDGLGRLVVKDVPAHSRIDRNADADLIVAVKPGKEFDNGRTRQVASLDAAAEYIKSYGKGRNIVIKLEQMEVAEAFTNAFAIIGKADHHKHITLEPAGTDYCDIRLGGAPQTYYRASRDPNVLNHRLERTPPLNLTGLRAVTFRRCSIPLASVSGCADLTFDGCILKNVEFSGACGQVQIQNSWIGTEPGLATAESFAPLLLLDSVTVSMLLSHNVMATVNLIGGDSTVAGSGSSLYSYEGPVRTRLFNNLIVGDSSGVIPKDTAFGNWIAVGWSPDSPNVRSWRFCSEGNSHNHSVVVDSAKKWTDLDAFDSQMKNLEGKGTMDMGPQFSMHRPVLWDANYRLRDAKAPTPGPREYAKERENDRVTHRYIYDSRRGLAQRETSRDGRSVLAVTRFVTTFPGGPTLFADSDGTVDVSMTDPFGRPWYMYRSREGSKPWYDQTPDANGRGTGILSTPPLPGSLFPGYAPWHVRTAEPDYLMGRRGVLGYNGLDQDLGMLLDAPQEARPEDSLSWWMKAGLLLDPVVDAWHGIGNWWNSLDTWDKKLRAGVGIGVAVLGAAVAVVALSGVEAIGVPMFLVGMALAGAAGYAGVNQAIHAADSNYDARSAARDMLIGGLAGLASAVAMLWAAGGAAGLAAAYEGGGMLTVAGIEASGGMAFGTTSSLLEGRSMQESLANGLAAATMAVVPTVAAMGLGRLFRPLAKTVTQQEVQFARSFNVLKGKIGSPGEGNVWHHIVEQRAANIEQFGAEAVHNTTNVVSVPRQVNQSIANYYSTVQPFTVGHSVRRWLGSQSWRQQFEYGQKILDRALSGQSLP